MKSALVIAILPAILIGYLNGLYWSKKGYNRPQYTILGMFAAYALIVRITLFFMN
jgi:hypothetical protein